MTKFLHLRPVLLIAMMLVGSGLSLAQTTVTLGTGSSSSSSIGPFQRSDTASTTVYSRFVHVYTAAELVAAGISNGVNITSLNFELASSNTIIGSGDADLKIYIKNSTASAAASGAWTTLITGSTLAVDESYNTTNNFPGSNGWMAFNFLSPFAYTGGALEIAVDWDCSQVSTPAFSGDGSIKWRWSSTAPDDLVVKKTSSSSAPSTISDLKDERANIQIEYSAAVACSPPTSLNAIGSATGAALNWGSVSSASSYNWKIVASGTGSSASAIASGNTSTTSAMASGLSSLTSYDLYVDSDCGMNGISSFAGPFSFATSAAMTSTLSLGAGTSSSSTRGPFQRSDTASTTVYSRFVHVYTQAELAAAGLTAGAVISGVNWDLASSNTIIGSGDANLKVYVKNSTATAAVSGTWTALTTGSNLAVDRYFNTVNNFPGANGWMPFNFNAPFTYTGGALEIAVDWDCSQIATPAFSGDGALKWRWSSTAPDDLVVKKTSSSSAPSTISDLKDERANMQIVYSVTSCDPPAAIYATPNSTMAYLNWAAASGASSYNWKIVPSGAGVAAPAIDSGSTSVTMDTAMALMPMVSYDLYVLTDCGSSTSSYGGPFGFMTQPAMPSILTFGAGTSSSSTRGPFQRSDTASTTVFSRFVHVYTAAELATAGVTNGSILTAINWELASSNQMIGDGDASLKVYIRNSTAISASADSWANLTAGSTLIVDRALNTTNNFLGANGWMTFYFNSPFNYTGGAIEIAVDWDCSQVTSPALSGDGSLKWRWSSTAPDSLVVKNTSSSSASTNISDLKDERANLQMIIVPGASCNPPSGLNVFNIDALSADLEWNPSAGASSYDYKVVAAGAGSAAAAVGGANTIDTSASIAGLSPATAYDLYVLADCPGVGLSPYMGPVTFTTDTSNVTLNELDYVNKLTVSPNPTDGISNIDLELLLNAHVDVAVYSISGELLKKVYSNNASKLHLAIDLSSYQAGLYLVRISVNDQSCMKKIILTK